MIYKGERRHDCCIESCANGGPKASLGMESRVENFTRSFIIDSEFSGSKPSFRFSSYASFQIVSSRHVSYATMAVKTPTAWIYSVADNRFQASKLILHHPHSRPLNTLNTQESPLRSQIWRLSTGTRSLLSARAECVWCCKSGEEKSERRADVGNVMGSIR